MLVMSAEKFSADNVSIAETIKEDFDAIVEGCDMGAWSVNVDGDTKGVDELLFDISESIKENDRQRCVESIAVLRCAIADMASAYSNAMDSMESLVVAIRDEENS